MRKIVLMMSSSLDGYMEGPNREIDWHSVDEEVHQHFNDVLAPMSAFLDGRVTYELMAGFWPTADQDPASTRQVAEFSRIWREMPKYVFTTTLQQADWNTTIVREVDVEAIRALKEQPGGDMAVGGADLAREFMRHDLVDEFRIYVHPALIGAGKRIFQDAGYLRTLRLVGSRAFTNGVVLLHYARA